MLSSIAISVTHANVCTESFALEGESCFLNDYAVRPVESIEM